MATQTKPTRALFTTSNSQQRLRDEAQFSQSRERRVYRIFPRFEPLKLKFKNAVVLLKMLVSFQPSEHLHQGVDWGSSQGWPHIFNVTAYPPLPPGASAKLYSPFLHIQTGGVAPGRTAVARHQGIICQGKYNCCLSCFIFLQGVMELWSRYMYVPLSKLIFLQEVMELERPYMHVGSLLFRYPSCAIRVRCCVCQLANRDIQCLLSCCEVYCVLYCVFPIVLH